MLHDVLQHSSILLTQTSMMPIPFPSHQGMARLFAFWEMAAASCSLTLIVLLSFVNSTLQAATLTSTLILLAQNTAYTILDHANE
jgi:hypothetical protein